MSRVGRTWVTIGSISRIRLTLAASGTRFCMQIFGGVGHMIGHFSEERKPQLAIEKESFPSGQKWSEEGN